jgi:hypothetical protein
MSSNATQSQLDLKLCRKSGPRNLRSRPTGPSDLRTIFAPRRRTVISAAFAALLAECGVLPRSCRQGCSTSDHSSLPSTASGRTCCSFSNQWTELSRVPPCVAEFTFDDHSQSCFFPHTDYCPERSGTHCRSTCFVGPQYRQKGSSVNVECPTIGGKSTRCCDITCLLSICCAGFLLAGCLV